MTAISATSCVAPSVRMSRRKLPNGSQEMYSTVLKEPTSASVFSSSPHRGGSTRMVSKGSPPPARPARLRPRVRSTQLQNSWAPRAPQRAPHRCLLRRRALRWQQRCVRGCDSRRPQGAGGSRHPRYEERCQPQYDCHCRNTAQQRAPTTTTGWGTHFRMASHKARDREHASAVARVREEALLARTPARGRRATRTFR